MSEEGRSGYEPHSGEFVSEDVTELDFTTLKKGDRIAVVAKQDDPITYDITVNGIRKNMLLVEVQFQYGITSTRYTARMEGIVTREKRGETEGIMRVSTEDEHNNLQFKNIKDAATGERVASGFTTAAIQKITVFRSPK